MKISSGTQDVLETGDEVARQARVTMDDIARELGVTKMTVSRGLRNAPGVSSSMRKRVNAKASAMGYKPDPILGALASYRTRRRAILQGATIALVAGGFTEGPWLRAAFSAKTYADLTLHAEMMGYSVDHFDLNEYAGRFNRLQGILRARGIRGLLINAPPTLVGELRWDWKEFSTVVVGSEKVNSPFHAVMIDHCSTTKLIAEELEKRGLMRPAVLLPHGSGNSPATKGRWMWALQALLQHFAVGADAVFDSSDGTRFVKWLHRKKPDVLLVLGHGDLEHWFGQSLPAGLFETCKICALDMDGQTPPGTMGIIQPRIDLIRVGLNHLHGMLIRNERGLSRHPMHISIPGRWVTPEMDGTKPGPSPALRRTRKKQKG